MSHFKEDVKNKYILMQKIGTGNYTYVHKAENKMNKEIRAIKIINLKDIRLDLEDKYTDEDVKEQLNKFIEDIKNEINIMKICGENNENSIKFYESFETDDEFAIVMELANENLMKFIKNKKLDSEEICEILIQLNKTFKIMKEKKIVHRDLKPRNILIKYKDKEQKDFVVKLCDYGISKKTTENTEVKTMNKGTRQYEAPEIMKLEEDHIYSNKCDLWSMGIIIYELYFGEVPEYNNVILGNIALGKKKLKKINDKELEDLINGLLEEDPNKRMSWDEYLNHPFFNVEKINRRR